MSHEIFLAGDHHFAHPNLLKFKRDDGTPLRVFSSTEEHDEHIISRHNETVRPQDHIYLIGDLAMDARALKLLNRMNGRKVLVRGNHDLYKLKFYLMNGIVQVHGCKVFTPKDTGLSTRVICTHVPIHPDCIGVGVTNAHAHLHYRRVLLPDGTIDPRYKCVSMEHLDNYAPINLRELVNG